MYARFSSLAAVLAFASLVLVGCAGDASEPDAEQGASTRDVPAEEGTLHPQGITYNVPTYYYFCWRTAGPSGEVLVGRTLDKSQALDATGLIYQYDDRTIPRGACYTI